MTPAARCQSAIVLLDEIEAGQSPADRLLANWFRSNRFAGSRDRAAIQMLVYAVLRHREQMDWWCRQTGLAITNRSRAMLLLALNSPWADAGVVEAFAATRYGPTPMTSEEAAICERLHGSGLDHHDQPAHVGLNLPAWLEAPLRRVFNDQFDIEMKCLVAEAAVDLRVNTLKTDRGALQARLLAEGIDSIPTRWSPLGLRLAGRRPLAGLASAREGLFEPQDEGSQIATLMTEVAPGNVVLDLCAGGGGKALGMAAMMRNTGRIVLADVEPRRLAQARPRLRRAGVTIAETVDLASDPALPAGAFDVVLVDAPCSGSGAWRRNPAAKWWLTPERFAEVRALQAQLLERAACLARVGGRVVYVTCSLLAEENRDQIDRFMAGAGKAFRLSPADAAWTRITGDSASAISEDLLLTPRRHGTDGFYIAILERLPA